LSFDFIGWKYFWVKHKDSEQQLKASHSAGLSGLTGYFGDTDPHFGDVDPLRF